MSIVDTRSKSHWDDVHAQILLCNLVPIDNRNDFRFDLCRIDYRRLDHARKDKSMVPAPELLKTVTIPTDIIEEEWATVRIYELAGNIFGMLAWPSPRDIDEERKQRLEHYAVELYKEERNERFKTLG